MSSAQYNLDLIDLQCFLEWGIDLLKVDDCFSTPVKDNAQYSQNTITRWRTLLPSSIILHNSRYGCMAKTPCKNIYSCPLNKFIPAPVSTYCNQVCDMYRISVDIEPAWKYIKDEVLARAGKSAQSFPGSWADLDSLMPFDQYFSFLEQRSQFSMWCILSSPLIISADMTTLKEEHFVMYGDENAIAVNQEYYGDSGDLIQQFGKISVFRKVLDNRVAILIQNFAKRPTLTYTFSNFHQLTAIFNGPSKACRVTNIWKSVNETITLGQQILVGPRDCVFLIFNFCE